MCVRLAGYFLLGFDRNEESRGMDGHTFES